MVLQKHAFRYDSSGVGHAKIDIGTDNYPGAGLTRRFSPGGFTLVLAGVKALLEHDIRLNLLADRFPDGQESP